VNHSIKKGFSFGLTSGIITTLGLMVGLYSSTGSKLVIIGGILVIAIADALSDALGMHMSEESEKGSKSKEIWQSTLSTFIFKFIFALSFVVPILLFNLFTAIIISIVWGILLLTLFSYNLAKQRKKDPLGAILEHILIAIVVIVVTYFVGNWVATF
jgi:VIT1/CCC1 family predicted Fe2+/Mn2+ transporter